MKPLGNSLLNVSFLSYIFIFIFESQSLIFELHAAVIWEKWDSHRGSMTCFITICLPYLCSFYFPNEKANTKNHWNYISVSGSFQHENRWWRWEIVHGFTASASTCFLPVSARLPRLCAWTGYISTPCSFQRWWSNGINEFPSHLNPKVKYLHQTNCICLATLVTLLPYFSSICWGAVCLWKTGYKVGVTDHILCIIIFLFIICIAVELRTPSPDRTLLN